MQEKKFYRLCAGIAVSAILALRTAAAWAGPVPIQPNSELTLKQATEIALKLHPRRLESESEVGASRSEVGVAQSYMLPQAYGLAQYMRTTDNGIGNTSWFNMGMYPRFTGRNHDQPSDAQSQTTDSSNNYMGGLSISQFLFDFGRARGFIDQRRADLDASQARLSLTDLNLIYDVAARYFALLAAQQEVIVFNEAIVQRTEHLRQAQEMAKADLRPGIDVSITQADLSRAQMHLIQAQNAVADSKVALDKAMGIAGEAPEYHLADQLSYQPVTETLGSLMSRAFSLRPDLKVLVAEATAAGAVVKQFQSDYFPTGNAQVGYTAMGTGLPAANNFFAGLVITWPIFNGFQTEDSIAAARYKQQAVGHAFEDMRQRVVAEVNTAFLNWQASVAVIKKAEETLVASRDELNLADKRYRQGLSSIIELDDAQRRYTADSAAYVQALYAYSTAKAAVRRATAESLSGM